MTRQTWAIVLAYAALLAAGCGSYDIETGNQAASLGSSAEQGDEPTDVRLPAALDSSSGQPADTAAGEQPGQSEPGAGSSKEKAEPTESRGPKRKPRQPAKPAPSSSAASRRPSIRLSMGIALPQTLTTGTAVGFSVEYRFVQGAPDPAAMYGWVIEPAKGQAVKQEVRLDAQGTLQGYVLQFRPENGPFSSHIVDAHGNRLSDSISLR